MNGLTIAAIVFGVLLLVVWLPILIVSIRKVWKATRTGRYTPQPLSEKEREQMARIDAEFARMDKDMSKTLKETRTK